MYVRLVYMDVKKINYKSVSCMRVNKKARNTVLRRNAMTATHGTVCNQNVLCMCMYTFVRVDLNAVRTYPQTFAALRAVFTPTKSRLLVCVWRRLYGGSASVMRSDTIHIYIYGSIMMTMA